MRTKGYALKTGCDVEAALSVIGGLWKPVILFKLLDGRKRFGELHRLMPNATQRMMTLQLRELEADGIVARHVYPEVPPRVEYELTAVGQSLRPILEALRSWGEMYRSAQGACRPKKSSPDRKARAA